LSEGGEDTKEDGAEESEDEIHIEKAQGSRLGGGKVVGGFYGLRKLTSDMAYIRGQ
jgi:hypothetical protein